MRPEDRDGNTVNVQAALVFGAIILLLSGILAVLVAMCATLLRTERKIREIEDRLDFRLTQTPPVQDSPRGVQVRVMPKRNRTMYDGPP